MNIDWRTILTNFILHYVTVGVGFFVAHFGWLNMDANNVSLALTQYIVAGLIAGIPLVLQHWKLSNILAQVKQFLTASAATGQVPTVAVTGTISPLTGVAKAAMILLCVGLVGMTGCKSSTATTQPTPIQTITDIENATDLLVQAITAANSAGLLSDAKFKEVMPYITATMSAEFAAEAAYKANDSATGSEKTAESQAALAALQSAFQSAQAATTQASGASQ